MKTISNQLISSIFAKYRTIFNLKATFCANNFLRGEGIHLPRTSPEDTVATQGDIYPSTYVTSIIILETLISHETIK